MSPGHREGRWDIVLVAIVYCYRGALGCVCWQLPRLTHSGQSPKKLSIFDLKMEHTHAYRIVVTPVNKVAYAG